MRYVIELERTADDHVEGVLRRDGMSESLPFSGWLELLSLLEPPRVADPEPGPGQHALERRAANASRRTLMERDSRRRRQVRRPVRVGLAVVTGGLVAAAVQLAHGRRRPRARTGRPRMRAGC